MISDERMYEGHFIASVADVLWAHRAIPLSPRTFGETQGYSHGPMTKHFPIKGGFWLEVKGTVRNRRLSVGVSLQCRRSVSIGLADLHCYGETLVERPCSHIC